MANPYNNSEGYPDPTAFFGEKSIRKEEAELEKRAMQAVGTVKLLMELCGFSIVGRITLRDIKTGKEFK